MSDESYDRLADRYLEHPIGFARTSSGVELRMLKKIVPPAEAELAAKLSWEPEPIESVADKFGLSVAETEQALKPMLARGLARRGTKEGVPGFRLAPFMGGLFEAQKANQDMDHEFAHLFEEWLMQAGGRTILSTEPAWHRVIPAQRAVKTEEILPYDDVRAILTKAKTFRLNDCACRIQKGAIGERCKFPLHVCLSFSMVERPAAPSDIPREQALSVIEEAEEVGLVHSVSNFADGWGYICNCCSCCCFILRGIADLGVANSVARPNYFAEVDSNHCSNCQICYDRCHVGAIAEVEKIAAVDLAKCIGCGLCVTACPDKVIHLHRRPDTEVIDPPANEEEWARARLAGRAAK